MRHKSRHIADDRRVVRQPERFVDVYRRRGDGPLNVDPFVYGHDAVGPHAVADEHLADGIRSRDEAVDLPVLPS